MKKFGLYILTPIASFLSGFYIFVKMWHFFLNENLNSNDFNVIFFWGGLPYLIGAVPFYFFIIHLIDKKNYSFKFLLYPIGCMLGFLIPLVPIILLWSGGHLFSSELILFYGFFLTSGLIFGILNWGIKKAFS